MDEDILFQENDGGAVKAKKGAHGIDIGFLFSILWRRRWYLLVPFISMMIVGCALAVKLPRIYESRTLIMVEPQRVPTDYVRPVVTEEIGNRINTISQQIMSRTSLEKIIEEFKLYEGPDYEKWFIEDKIENLRKRIRVRVSNSKNNESFSISFEGKEPVQVSRITKALVNYFMEENLKFRESKAIGTSNFLEDELRVMRRRLEESEDRLKKYKERYMGGLPEQLASNLSVIDRLQQQLNSKQEALRDAKNRLAIFNMESSAIVKYHVSNFSITSPTQSAGASGGLSKLEELKLELDDLRTKYTENHPDIVHLKNRLTELETKNRERAKSDENNEEGDEIVYEAPPRQGDPVHIREVRRKELEAEIDMLDHETGKIAERIEHFQKLVEDTPNREQELLSIQRDYRNVQQSYNSMLEKKLQAEIAVNLEKKQKGEQFRIIDPARVPTKPVRPDMKKFFFMIVAAGLGLGGGMTFLLEFFDTSFRRSKDAEDHLGLQVLVAIPKIGDRQSKFLKRAGFAVSGFALVAAIVCLAAFASLSFYGVESTLSMVNRCIALSV